MFEGRGHDVLGQAVQPVCQLTTSGWPPRGEPFVASPTQQQGLGAQRLVERGLVEIFAVLDLADPAADPETLVTGRVLDHPVERDVLAHDDPSHFGSPLLVLAAITAAVGGRRYRECLCVCTRRRRFPSRAPHMRTFSLP